jgi:outer membrane protein assembly factor BamB
MKRSVTAILTVMLVTMVLQADEPERIYSNPNVPSREVLDRLNLQLAWRGFLPMDGRRDGFFSLQVAGKDLLVQTRSGQIAVLDAETGQSRWRTRVGKAYGASYPLGYNSRSVFVFNNAYLYALDRASGREQWKFPVPEALSAPPVADEEMIFLCSGTTHLYCYLLPSLEPPPAVAARTDKAPVLGNLTANESIDYLLALTRNTARGTQPSLYWDTITNIRLELAPVVGREAVFVISPTGDAVAYTRVTQSSGVVSEAFRFATDGPVLAPPAIHEDIVYIASQDANVYALNLNNGITRWRFTAGTPVDRTPVVTEQDVYVIAERKGMSRLDRATGETSWRVPRGTARLTANPDAKRFLATNSKFVYAADRAGRLLILDRARGTLLSSLDVHDFVFPVVNDMTDRLYLAANNGLLVCLHDREYKRPQLQRKVEEKPVAGKPLTDADRLLSDRLETTVTNAGGEAMPLKDLLKDLSEKYKVVINLSDRAFTELGLEAVSDKPVVFPRADREPLKSVLEKILTQVNATFQTAGGTIQVVPAPPKQP